MDDFVLVSSQSSRIFTTSAVLEVANLSYENAALICEFIVSADHCRQTTDDTADNTGRRDYHFGGNYVMFISLLSLKQIVCKLVMLVSQHKLSMHYIK